MLAPRSLLLPERTIPRFTCPCSRYESSPGALRPYRERCCRAVGWSAGFPGLSRPGVLLSGRALTLWSRGSKPRGAEIPRIVAHLQVALVGVVAEGQKITVVPTSDVLCQIRLREPKVRSKLATAFPCRQRRPASI